MNNIKNGADLKGLERSKISCSFREFLCDFSVGHPCSLGTVSTLSTGYDKTVGHFTRGAVREPLHMGLSEFAVHLLLPASSTKFSPLLYTSCILSRVLFLPNILQ